MEVFVYKLWPELLWHLLLTDLHLICFSMCSDGLVVNGKTITHNNYGMACELNYIPQHSSIASLYPALANTLVALQCVHA